MTSRDAVALTLGAIPPLLVDLLVESGFRVDQRAVVTKNGMIPDVSSSQARSDIRQLALASDVAFVFCVPPCSTASRARDRPVPTRLIRKGWPNPPRLRTDSQPRGVTDLLTVAPRDVARVQAENDFADFVGHLSIDLTHAGITWAIESGRHSYLWQCGLDQTRCSPEAGLADCDLCMVGGSRDKGLRFACYPFSAFLPLCGLCDGSHTHAGFTLTRDRRTDTQRLLPYPAHLCELLTTIATHSAARKGLSLHPGRHRPPPGRRTADDRIGAGTQARGDSHSQLVPEYAEVDTISICDDSIDTWTSMVGETLSHGTTVSGIHLDKGSRVLRVVEKGVPGLPPTTTPTRTTFADWEQAGFPADGYLYVGRRHRSHGGRVFPASPYCNPFRLASCTSRAECLAKFRVYFLARPDFPSCLRPLASMTLVCHCPLGSSCHIDVLVKAFQEEMVARVRHADALPRQRHG